ncbi:outer membrane transport protein (OMPP1/FadL/TodX family) [Campylobacter iguaniorum]|uniref:Outer membrane transport protein (OMPP1/FadL/TodX family) n=1 Tax=Campylobacter iguaniorum TaxID=1244531 RepID=A0A076FHX3_9BACT|nr:OmpP1/FadL family transporter [Campylobacter iguaniorum]AII15389.1 outer membrane transport protein (OMPP1/FadL/TodX family) [Campylobacter iguaniorum]
MTNLKKVSLLALATSTLYAAGYKIPEQSSDSVALSASNVAFSFGPDAAYYNPANMMYVDDVRHYFENSFTYIHLGKSRFDPDVKTAENYTTTSQNADFLVPTFHFVSPEYIENWRFGLSFVVPSGLSMRWKDTYPASTANNFSLKVFELNPSAAYRVSDELSIAAGFRVIYATGKVSTNPNGSLGGATLNASRQLEGDDVNFGWNAAITYRPVEDLSLVATYRSKIDMNLEGNAQITSSTSTFVPGFNGSYNGPVSVNIPLPAVLTLGLGYKIDDVTLLAAFERTYWSKLERFDFNYGGSSIPAQAVFDKPVEKNFHDSNTYRLGVAWDATNKLRLMAGFAYDESPSDPTLIGFELPDTSAYIYSVGLNYKYNEDIEIAFGYLFQDRQNRHIDKNDERAKFNNVVGEMTNANSQLVNLGIKYRF